MKATERLMLFCLLLALSARCRRNASGFETGPAALRHLKTEFGGCNLARDLGKALRRQTGESDTVFFETRDDTLHITIGRNHICCVYFKVFQRQEGDELTITLYDACADTDRACYCTCVCYYRFDVYYVNFPPDVPGVTLRVYLWDALASRKSLIHRSVIGATVPACAPGTGRSKCFTAHPLQPRPPRIPCFPRPFIDICSGGRIR